jgi:hypothetical protein
MMKQDAMYQQHKKCSKCDGCGQVADSEDQEPWSWWLSLPVSSAAAVLAGIVKPIPCPACKWTGEMDTEPKP